MQLFLTVTLLWLAMSAILFIGSMGEVSPLPGAEKQKTFWKWSTLLTFYGMIPFFGWMIGAIHAYHAWKNYRRFNPSIPKSNVKK